jgi:Flp pilus assembly protein TadD
MRHFSAILFASAIGLSVAHTAPAPDGGTIVAEANALVKAHRAQEAVVKLAPFAAARAGEPEFELPYGLALLESDRGREAAAAFRRVLAKQPDHIFARAYLGRALATLGAFHEARREMTALGDRPNLPAEVKKVVLGNIAMIDKALRRSEALAAEATAADGDRVRVLAAADLLRNRRAPEALASLEPLALRLAGNPDFDYVYGIALIDAGRPADAVPVLNRALQARPDFHVARAELGRALAGTGDLAGARREFNALHDVKDLPQAARGAMGRQVSAIDKKVAEQTATRVNGFVEVAFGYDNNVNNGPSTDSLVIPALAFFGPATLSPAALPRGTGFASLSGGLSIAHPLSSDLALFVNLVGTGYSLFKHDEFNTTIGGGEAGIARQVPGLGVFSIAAIGQVFAIGGDVYRNIYGAAGQWRQTFDGVWHTSLALSWLALQYPGIPQQDADRYTLAASVSRKYDLMFATVVTAAVSGGIEKVRDPATDFLTFDFINVRLALEATLTPAVVLFAQASYETRQYAADYPLFFYRRADEVLEFVGGFDVMVAEGLYIRPSVRYIEIWSNVDLYDTRRTVTQVAMRRQF